MKKPVKEEWKLDLKDVEFGGRWGILSKIRKSGGVSRAVSLQTITIELTHRPTGMRVHKTIEGYYSRKQMQNLRKDSEIELLKKLELEVRKALRFPGRCD